MSFYVVSMSWSIFGHLINGVEVNVCFTGNFETAFKNLDT